MSISVVQTAATSARGPTVAFSSPLAVGSDVLLVMAILGGGSTTGPTGGGCSIWAQVGTTVTTGRGSTMSMWIGTNSSGGSGAETVTFNGSQDGEAWIAELGGGALTSPLDSSSTQSGTTSTGFGTDFTTSTITPSASGGIVVVAWGMDGNSLGTHSPSSPWIVPATIDDGGGTQFAIAYQIGVASGTGYSTVWNGIDNGQPFVAISGAVKAIAGGSPPQGGFLGLMGV